MASDSRGSVYEQLHHEQLVAQEADNRASARIIMEALFARYRPRSVLDVGCGLGTWLSVAAELGAAEVAGLEGAWLDRKLARVDERLIVAADLERPFDLGRRFDLVISLEVAEHLSAQAAAGFVASLARHGDVVLFSAAIPHQGGHHHVNEQFAHYWADLFAAHGYVPLDFVRSAVWGNNEVLLWLRQNTLVFALEALTRDGEPFAGLGVRGPISVVHPFVYLARIEAMLEEQKPIFDMLAAGRTIRAERRPDGSLSVRAVDEEK